MKCPECMGTQRHKDGMKCHSCGYQFALDPKKPPHITDIALKNVIDRISGNGQYYFTYDQLFAQVYRIIKKKQNNDLGCLVFPFVLTGLFIFAILHISIPFLEVGILILYVILGVGGIVRYAGRPVTIPCSRVSRTISVYQKTHPIDRLVKSRMFQKLTPEDFDDEIFQYAPERILIVEREDIADMLILNRFPLEHKTLVVSEQKYPEHAFNACQQFLSQHPEIPVILIHDASGKGLRMKKRLSDDDDWNLREKKNVQDLGLFPREMNRLRQPIWLPPGASVYGEILGAEKSANEKISKGYRMPVDTAPPAEMMGSVSFALVSGLILLSEEFITEQHRRTSVYVDFGEGFG